MFAVFDVLCVERGLRASAATRVTDLRYLPTRARAAAGFLKTACCSVPCVLQFCFLGVLIILVFSLVWPMATTPTPLALQEPVHQGPLLASDPAC